MENKNVENNQQGKINIPETPIPEYDPIRFINYRLRTNPYVTTGGTNAPSNSTRNTVRPNMLPPTTVFVSQMLYPNMVRSYVPMGSYRHPLHSRPKVPPGFIPRPHGFVHGTANSFRPYHVHPQYMPQTYIPISNCSYYDPRTVAIASSHTNTNSGPAICSMIATYTHINSVPVMTSMTLGCTKAITSSDNIPGVFTKTVSYVNDTCVTVESVSYNNMPVTCKVTYSHINDPVVSVNTDPAGDPNAGHKHDVPASTNDGPLPPVIFTAATFTPLTGLGVTNTWTAQESNPPVLTIPITTYPNFWSLNESVNYASTTASTSTVTNSGPVCSSKLWESNFPSQNGARRKQIFQGPICNSDSYRSSQMVFPPQRPRENRNRPANAVESNATSEDDFEEIADIIRIVTPETVFESADSFKDGEGPRIENYVFYDKEFNIWKTYKPKWETVDQNSKVNVTTKSSQQNYPELYSQSFFYPPEPNQCKKVENSKNNPPKSSAFTADNYVKPQNNTRQKNYPEVYSQTFFYPSKLKTADGNSKKSNPKHTEVTTGQTDPDFYSLSFFSDPKTMDQNSKKSLSKSAAVSTAQPKYTCQQNDPSLNSQSLFSSPEQNQWKQVGNNSKKSPTKSAVVTTRQYNTCQQTNPGVYSQNIFSPPEPNDNNSKKTSLKSTAGTTDSIVHNQQNDPGSYSLSFFSSPETNQCKPMDNNSKKGPTKTNTGTAETFMQPQPNDPEFYSQSFFSPETNQSKPMDENPKKAHTKLPAVATESLVQPQFYNNQQNHPGFYSQRFFPSLGTYQYKPMDESTKKSLSKSTVVTTESFVVPQQNYPGLYSQSVLSPSEPSQWIDYSILGEIQDPCTTTKLDTPSSVPEEYHVPDTSMMVHENYTNNQNAETQENLHPINCVQQDMKKITVEEMANAEKYKNGYSEIFIQDITGTTYHLDYTGYMTPEPYISFILYNPFTPEQIAEFNKGSGPATKPNTAETAKENGATGIHTKDARDQQEKNTTVPGSKPVETTAPKPLKVKEYKPPVPKKVAAKKSSTIATTNTKNLKMLYKEPVEQAKKLPQGNKSNKSYKAQVPEKEAKNTGKPFAKNNKSGKNKSKEEEEKPKQKGKQQKSSKKK